MVLVCHKIIVAWQFRLIDTGVIGQVWTWRLLFKKKSKLALYFMGPPKLLPYAHHTKITRIYLLLAQFEGNLQAERHLVITKHYLIFLFKWLLRLEEKSKEEFVGPLKTKWRIKMLLNQTLCADRGFQLIFI